MALKKLAVFVGSLRMLYVKAAIRASQILFINWIIIFASIACYFLFEMCTVVVSALPGGGGGFSAQGLLLGMAGICLLALYYSWLADSVDGQHLTWRNLFKFDFSVFWNVLGAAFVLMIINFAAAVFKHPDTLWAYSGLNFFIFIMFNPLPESIYLNRLEGLPALVESAKFVHHNWFEWFLPFAALLLPVIAAAGAGVLPFLSSGDPLLPPIIIEETVSFALGEHAQWLGKAGAVVSVAAVTWFMMFRGFLFKDLVNSTRRQRMHAASQKSQG